MNYYETIIEQVEGPTPSVNPVAVVPKPSGDAPTKPSFVKGIQFPQMMKF